MGLEEKSIAVSPLFFAAVVLPDAVPSHEDPEELVVPCKARVLSLGHPPARLPKD